MLKKLINNKRFSEYSIWVIFTLLGFYVGFLTYGLIINYYNLSVSGTITLEINPFDIISLIVNVLLVVVILRYFQKTDDLEKIEKELLVKDIRLFQEDFCSFLRRVVQKSGNSEITYQETVRRFKRFRMQFDSLIKLASGEENTETILSLKSIMYDINRALTDHSVVSDVIQFEEKDIDSLAELDYLFKTLMFKYIVEIIKKDR
jgi:hypothetical protein